jgi:hypothetical protein
MTKKTQKNEEPQQYQLRDGLKRIVTHDLHLAAGETIELDDATANRHAAILKPAPKKTTKGGDADA